VGFAGTLSGAPANTGELDDTDRNILVLLGENARQSVREIARRIQMSPGAVADRVTRLEQSGVILGWNVALAQPDLRTGVEDKAGPAQV
jgi:DNA-binding Lrp family transcriptional regulator